MRTLLAFAAVLMMALPAAALERSGDGYYHTGDAVREAYEMNGYGDAAKIAAFTNALSAKELKEGDAVTIRYDAARKTTTISGPGGSATVAGEDFMRATWSIWFGKIDQPELGDHL